MSKLNARHLVAHLLEYGVDPDGPRPGQPDDPWRQQTGPLPDMRFLKKRPASGQAPETETDPEAPTPVPIKHKANRFNWKPQSESVLQELGGHYCFNCKSPCDCVLDEPTGTWACAKCKGPLRYPKSSSLTSREVQATPVTDPYRYPKGDAPEARPLS